MYIFSFFVALHERDTKNEKRGLHTMAYALFSQTKVALTGNINSVSLQQTQRSNEQYGLANNTLSLQQQLSSIQAAQSTELAALYGRLSSATTTSQRDRFNDQIHQKEQEFQAEVDEINRKIYVVGIKENAIEMVVKRLDTQLSALQKQLEAVEEAEGDGIEKSTPKFNGVG